MRRLGIALGGLRTVYEGGVVAGMTDAELLERFARGEGEGDGAAAAFAVLADRHGPMVMRVCRGSIGDEHDAEDAFQAVFLVLARKAKTLWVRDSLGPWLHGVAVRTSAHVRGRNERVRSKEGRLDDALEVAGEVRGIDHELVRAVHEEVGRLPDRYREAVVLCDLEGCSHEEAAGRLGCPIGTVKSRQARGRERLRARLARRGLAPAEFAVARALASSPIPAGSITATVRAAVLLKSGGGATVGTVSAASALARTISGSMAMGTLKTGVLAFLACVAVGSGTFGLVRGMRAEDVRAARPGPDGPPAIVVPSGPRPPAGTVFAMRFAADPRHDGDALGPVYRWIKVEPSAKLSLDGLVSRVEGNDVMVALKPDPQNLTERDLREVKTDTDERGHPAIGFEMTPDGARRLGELTRGHLPEEAGTFKHRLALIVEGAVVGLPFVNSEIRGAGVIEFGTQMQSEELDRIVQRMADAAAYNAPPPTARAVKDRAEAVREARAVDLPALAGADRVVVDPTAKGYRMNLRNPKFAQRFVQALRPSEQPEEGGALAATLWFYRGDELLRKVWVREGGEWGFERPGASWTTGADPELWRLVKDRLKPGGSFWDWRNASRF